MADRRLAPHLLLAVLAALGLASCAQPNTTRAPGAQARAYFPLEPGGHWSYDLDVGPFSSTSIEVSALGERAVRDSDAPVFLMEERIAGRAYGLEPAGIVGYRIADGFLLRFPAVSLEDDGRVRMLGGDGVRLLPIDPQPAQKWSDRPELFTGSGSSGQRWTAAVEHVGSMSVAAGRFDDVIVVRSEQWDPQWSETKPLHRYEDYYARGVGLIRSISRNQAQWFFMGVEQELTTVRFD